MQLQDQIQYNPGGILSKVLRKEGQNVTLFCMAAGTEISEHTATKNATVYVIEGKGTFTLEGKKIPMEPGRIIFMTPNQKHALHAGENTSFLLILS